MKAFTHLFLFCVGIALGVLPLLIHHAWAANTHALLLAFAATWLALLAYAIKRIHCAPRRRHCTDFLRPNPPRTTE